MTVVTVTLNAAVDKTYIVPDFTLDRIHRPIEARTSAGGKGINVARVYGALGADAIATGFLGGTNGDYLAVRLAEERIPADFVRVAEESRVAIAVLDPKARTQTEVNEIGPQVTSKEVEALVEKVKRLLGSARWLALSGSIPPGVPTDIYARLIRLARKEGVRSVLDTSGEPLKAAISERPFLVKPNRHELAAIGISISDWAEAPQAAQDLRTRYDLELAIVTGGQNGAVLAAPTGVWQAGAPQIDVLSAVGSGDSLTAAFVWALDREPKDYAGALRWGVAAGAANALTASPGDCSKEQIEALWGKIKSKKLRLTGEANKTG